MSRVSSSYSHQLQLCNFGRRPPLCFPSIPSSYLCSLSSFVAAIQIKGKQNIAPKLIFGGATAIYIWSSRCLLAKFLPGCCRRVSQKKVTLISW
ncbi:hypothetical protein GOP47_0004036 [Adiantum capillus-veneris]|uniref:Uncharacterized protein n=1 Tax=Adiantum capillus-veneris TaxID=13818 RepID=A0A9D4V817_ADICA|nr:hypothetical protein GOP47_0004036 [Adiantum capillus-veneris]